MRSLDFQYIFKHPFEIVVRAYFQKYTSGKDQNVTSITVIEHKQDPKTGEEYILRRGTCANILPAVFRRFCPSAVVEVEEEAWLKRKERILHLHSYNITGSSYVKLEEYSTYTQSNLNDNWTVMEQRGVITADGLGPILGRMLESFSIHVFKCGADKGFTIMEDLLMAMNTVSSSV
ncbi:PRELI domain-containing protein 2 [Exaiptasia diaphana]|uniref:PRELI/MSF1 domain-containing protein n=1 Tax=Exaiptasia diaphana TaxID=2652724 RepID=A0A913XDA2_EXADI|nr:PRELI domain-containing protein 2 [Exaiptasia diaphana]KXJ26417.1 PRELI domain-containing protein 2 [Exaiptasia diaphana]